MPLITSRPFLQAPAWSSITEGSATFTNSAFSNRGVLQNVGGDKIIALYADQTPAVGLSAQSYTVSGTSVSIDASSFDFETTGNYSGWVMDATYLTTNKALFGTQKPPVSTGAIRVIEAGSGTLNIGTEVTFNSNGETSVAGLTATEAVALNRRFSGSNFTELKKLTITGTNITVNYTTNIGTQLLSAHGDRFDNTHVTMAIRNLSPSDVWETRTYNMGVSSFTQVGSSATLTGFTVSPAAGRVRIERLRDDGDGIVFAAYNYEEGAFGKKIVKAFKVNSTTYNVTQGSALTLSGAAPYSTGSSNPVARIDDSRFMVTTDGAVFVVSVDGSLNCTEDSTLTVTSGSFPELEHIDGTRTFRRYQTNVQVISG